LRHIAANQRKTVSCDRQHNTSAIAICFSIYLVCHNTLTYIVPGLGCSQAEMKLNKKQPLRRLFFWEQLQGLKVELFEGQQLDDSRGALACKVFAKR
jgi:hypothetical protein